MVVASGFQIDLEVGSIQGKIDAAKPSDKAFASFTSIPFAEPPIGKLRFKDPVGKKYALNYVKFALNTSSFCKYYTSYTMCNFANFFEFE